VDGQAGSLGPRGQPGPNGALGLKVCFLLLFIREQLVNIYYGELLIFCGRCTVLVQFITVLLQISTVSVQCLYKVVQSQYYTNSIRQYVLTYCLCTQ